MINAFLAIILAAANGPFIFEDPATDRLIRQAMESSYNLKLAEARQVVQRRHIVHDNHEAA